MAKVGYIYQTPYDDGLEEAREWMRNYGCVQIAEEDAAQERKRPVRKRLTDALVCGDEIVVAKFSNAVRGVRELAAFLAQCRVKSVRVVSIGDRLDTAGKLFAEATPADVLHMFGTLPEEVLALRHAAMHVKELKHSFAGRPKKKTKAAVSKQERESVIVSMYNEGKALDEIWMASGFRSRSSVFRILKKHGVTPNRGNLRGPHGGRKPKAE